MAKFMKSRKNVIKAIAMIIAPPFFRAILL